MHVIKWHLLSLFGHFEASRIHFVHVIIILSSALSIHCLWCDYANYSLSDSKFLYLAMIFMIITFAKKWVNFPLCVWLYHGAIENNTEGQNYTYLITSCDLLGSWSSSIEGRNTFSSPQPSTPHTHTHTYTHTDMTLQQPWSSAWPPHFPLCNGAIQKS